MSSSNILAARDPVITSCMSNRVTIVLGETGTGKSTYVPMWISEASPSNKIVCAQPRRVAATSIAHRVSTLMGESGVGGSVGYRVRGDVVGSESSRIVYATGGYLRTALSCDPSLLENYTHVVLDEVHERSLDSDFLSLIVKLLLLDRYPRINLVVMSATIDCQIFQDYFQPLCGPGEVVNILEIPPPSDRFHIETLHIAECSDEQFSDSSVDMTCSLAVSHATDGFTTLIFLPGEAEIMAVEKRLLSHYIDPSEYVVCLDEDFSSFDANLAACESVYYQIHVLHSLVPSVDQRRALRAPVGARGRHIVLSTNIAESSLTVEAVNLVIDSGLRRESVWHRNISSLKTRWTSRASLTQRRGRTGRVCNGKVIRLFSKEIEESLPSFDVPECLVANPVCVFLSAKFLAQKWNKDPKWLLEQLLSMQESNTFDIESIVEELFNEGVLSSLSETSNLTIFGSLATWLQLEVRVAKIVFLALLADLPIEGIVLAAASVCEKDPFKFGSVKNEHSFFHAIENSFKHRILYDMGLASDHLMWRNLLVAWISMRTRYDSGKEGIYATPFVGTSVFAIEFQNFKNLCLQILRGLDDWLRSDHTSVCSNTPTNRDAGNIKNLLDALFAQAETDEKIYQKIQLFKSVLNDRKKCAVAHSELSSIFLPMTDYVHADVLKLILAVAAGTDRILYANASFPRCEGEVFSVEGNDVWGARRICGGIEPREVRPLGKDNKSLLVFSGSHTDEDGALAVPRSSEFAAVTTNVAIRNLLCLFEKSWKVGDVKKPYVFNICRWFLPATPLDAEDTRVYLNVRNPSGWLETRKNSPESFRAGRGSLGNTFFCVPSKLSMNGSLVKAEMNTVLPIRSGGRVAITMLLAAVPFRGSSVKNRLVKDEQGRECVDVLNRLVTTRSEFPITNPLVERIDTFRELVTRAVNMDNGPKKTLTEMSAEFVQSIQNMMDLANEDSVENTPDSVAKTNETARLFELRMDAIMMEVEEHWDSQRKKLSLKQIENTCNTIWDMYEYSLLEL